MDNYEKSIQWAKIMLGIFALVDFNIWMWNFYELLKIFANK